ncbi:guanylate kinase [Faecalicatena contorta]|uniref:guanylate kinase n=1 Tax=Faecalicatena contorta TaxID=39482 RepID=UPI001F1C5DDA|nr:guanylate kinase [Faecalicatena contorta]MCF2679141.1 guanylate kinase [Faecalicatena contorta]
MGKIYYIMGKSSSGKDTLFKAVRDSVPMLRTVTLYTTRPPREGETDGVEYYFISDDIMEMYAAKGKVIELRTYNTVHGAWKYATIDDGQIHLEEADYLMIGTLESYEKMCAYYGKDMLVPIYIEVEDGERLSRALVRERQQARPRYAELCRRFLADTEDFSEENLLAAGIRKRFYNDDKTKCLEEIIGEIQHGKL